MTQITTQIITQISPQHPKPRVQKTTIPGFGQLGLQEGPNAQILRCQIFLKLGSYFTIWAAFVNSNLQGFGYTPNPRDEENNLFNNLSNIWRFEKSDFCQ